MDDASSLPDPDLFDYKAKLEVIPESPGVYLMIAKNDKIVYIGKSINLKSRVRSYFTGGDPRPFVKRLPKILKEIEFIVAPSEKDALILEATLIKKHKPRYNVLLKDDKNYMWLRVDTRSEWPRVEVTRFRKKNQGRYFGPYPSSFAVRHTLGVLNRHFMLRTCPDAVLNNRSRPCLQYQIKRCPGPCVMDVSTETYDRHVQEAIMFLEGRQPELKARLVERMMEASSELEYELAAHYRDQIKAIDSALQSQQMVATHYIDQDVFGIYREGDRLTLQLMFVRRGKLQGTRAFSFKDQEFPDEEVISSFISQYYLSGNTIPHEVLLPLELESADAMGTLLSEERGRKVQVLTPQRGSKHKLVETATINATHTFRAQQGGEDQLEDLLIKLQKKLRLSQLPERIECFDISNFQGKPIVGSMVVFEGGAPASSEYRHFKVQDVTEQDDFASMYEVLTRRFKRTLQGDWPKPDLVVIDGGKGQLSQAVTVLSDLGIHDVDVIALAKGRVERDAQSEVVTRSLERVFLPGRKTPLILRQNSAELFLLQRVRDEAHRSAITFHRKLRRKETLKSSLEEVPGVGIRRRKALIKHFGSVKRVQSATVGELSQVPGISGRMAREIFRFFNSDIALDAEL